MKDISIILVNYNTAQLTLDCIKSIYEKTSEAIDFEIIVVDNGSQYEDYELLKNDVSLKNNEAITLLRERKNLGFGGGNMVGVNVAVGNYYALINNDVILKNDCLGILYEFLETHPAALAGGSQLDSEGTLKASFDYFLTLKRELLGRGLLHKIKPQKYLNRKKPYDLPIRVDCIPGSFMLCRASSFNAVGGFDSTIFLYYEESDLCIRIKHETRDGHCYHVPKACYYHLTGASTTKSQAIKLEMKLSRNYVLKKHSSTLFFKLFYLFEMLLQVFKTVKGSIHRKLFMYYVQGFPMHKSLKNKQVIHDK